MAIVQSLGNLTDLQPNWTTASIRTGVMLYDSLFYDYATLYRTQPNVRTCVDFLARNIAQLGLHVFRRVSETDRERLRDHPLARVISKPNPYTTRYRLIESLVSDFGIYWNAYWLKLPGFQGNPVSLLRVPPVYVTGFGGLAPSYYEVNLGTKILKLTPDQLIHFRGYNPEHAVVGLSPIETLRRVLAEEFAAGDYREYFWRNAARMNGIIERPADAPEWSATARERFKAEFEALYSGGVNSGKTAILEEGMTWKQTTFSAQESEYLAGRKLTREECARAYHIPLPMVGILDHATFSNIREQHKQLYQDCLGPWLAMIEDEIELQLLPDLDDGGDVYCEFNIAEKLQGSFEEQTAALQSAVGRPWMTPNEARARFNMPSLDGDADALATPLNVLVGGQASPRDSAPKALIGMKADEGEAENKVDPTLPIVRARHVQKWAEVLKKYFGRQYQALIGRVRDGAGLETVWLDGERWDTELSEDILKLNTATATVWAKHVTGLLDIEFDEERMSAYLAKNAELTAAGINRTTMEQVGAALLAKVPKDAVKQVFEIAQTSRAREIATSKVTSMANFGSHEGARQGGLRTKTWQVNSANPRDEHAAMNGETVGIDDLFSNGMRWPGDPAGGAENNANCFPGEVTVSVAGVERAYRRWYEGELVEIVTARGYRLAATPNHPILTPVGWRPLHLLTKGDYVVSRLGSEDVAAVDPDVEHVDAPISEVFDLLAIDGARQRIPGVVEQFHGDGQHGDVDVVATHGELGNGVQTALSQPVREQALALADVSQGSLLPQGALGHLGFGALLPAHGGVGSLGAAATLGRAQPGVAEELGLASATGRDSGLDQSSADHGPSTAKAFGDSQLGLAGLIATEDGARVHGETPRESGRTVLADVSTRLVQDSVNGGYSDAEALGKGLHALAGFVAPDKIVGIRRLPFRGHVYNLQTVSGWYTANSIVAHNCHCSVTFGR